MSDKKELTEPEGIKKLRKALLEEIELTKEKNRIFKERENLNFVNSYRNINI